MRRVLIGCWLLFGLSATLFAAEEIAGLRASGDAALASGDYVAATYYFERIRESKEWNSFPEQVDILSRLALIEETLNRFERAAELYGQIVELTPPTAKSPNFPMRRYYQLHYAECLEHAGFYSRAEPLYWEMLKDAEIGQKASLLLRIIKNYEFQKVPEPKLETLHNLVMHDNLETLGWNLAELYRIQGKPAQSVELFDALWPNNPLPASTYTASLVEVYTALGKLDDLVNRVRMQQEKQPNSWEILTFEISLLEQVNRGKEALEVLDKSFASFKDTGNGETDIGLIARVPKALLFQWVDLIAQHRNRGDAVEWVRKLTDLAPLDMDWRERLSGLLANAGKKEEAVQVWEAWAHNHADNPLMVLNAVDRIASLGFAEKAAQLLGNFQGRIPPPLASKEAETALHLGRFEQALAAYENAVQAKTIAPSEVGSAVLRYAESASNLQPLAAALIQVATRRELQQMSPWLRETLLEIGVRAGRKKELEALADQDKAGGWKLFLAKTAWKHGDQEWATRLLESIPKVSLYRSSAEQELAMILCENGPIPSQIRAADLLQPLPAEVLDASVVVPLTDILVERLLRYAEIRLNAYQAPEALSAIRCIESASATLGHPPAKPVEEKLLFQRARALTELASFQPALALLDRIQSQPLLTEARYLQAQILLSQNQVEEAQSLLKELVEGDEFWRRANDALALLVALEPLVGDSLNLFCESILYQLQGRWKEAEPVLRQLAVEQYGKDTEEWARFTIGKWKADFGDEAGARKEWDPLLLEADHPVILGMLRLHRLHRTNAAGEKILDMTAYQELLLDHPDSLISDRARLTVQQEMMRIQP